jgi:peptidoglycan/LPS O-acetylase OafA/YrhL
MIATSPVFAVVALTVAVLTLLVIDRLLGSAPVPNRRYSSLDGLRGYLALAVFLHHTAIWYFYLRTGRWELPPSRLYIHFGQSSVAMFFMITALLFWSKIMDGRDRPIDWLRLYISRLLRLVPLYLVAVAALWLVALAAAGFVLLISPRTALTTTIRWLSFTILGMPAVNNFAETNVIAGVAWSLPYEWWFYGILPVAALLFRRRQPWPWLALGLVVLWTGSAWALSPERRWITASFLGGIAAVYAARNDQCRRFAKRPAASVICGLALIAAARTDTAFSGLALPLLSVAFVIIACGNSVFGILDWRVSRILGEMGYSLYLLHGFVLFAAFRGILGARAAELTVFSHWAVALICTPVLVAVCYATFNFIEWPAMSSADRLTAVLRQKTQPAAAP